MKKVFVVTAALALLGSSVAGQTSIIIDTITVGNPGNAGELSGAGAGGYGPDKICGSVSYAYNIAKYEVTAGQYTAFLNAIAKTDTYGLYNSYMWSDPYGCKIQRNGSNGNYDYSVSSDWANRPVNYVSFWDACRFANWLGNDQRSGAQDTTTTERGAYTLDGYNGTDGRTIKRNADWVWAVTSEDEWYKAAYYKGGGTNAGFWLYPTQNNSTPSRDMTDISGNNANYYNNSYLIGSPYYRTEVGEFQNSESAYGTFDQGGNVWEWNEALPNDGYAYRGLRGGSSNYFNFYYLRSSYRGNHYNYLPDNENSYLGFRVSLAVPEPSGIIALLGGLTGLIGICRRK